MIKNAIILNIIHNIFNLLDTEVVVCIIIVILNSWFINIAESGDNHQQSINQSYTVTRSSINFGIFLLIKTQILHFWNNLQHVRSMSND